MAIDYVPGLKGPDPTTLFAGGDLHSGSGAPSDSLGSNGDVYVDRDSGTAYTKSGGVWSLVTGGGASGLAGVGSPEGAQVGSPGQTYVATDSNNFWVKVTGSATNTGWVALIA